MFLKIFLIVIFLFTMTATAISAEKMLYEKNSLYQTVRLPSVIFYKGSEMQL